MISNTRHHTPPDMTHEPGVPASTPLQQRENAVPCARCAKLLTFNDTGVCYGCRHIELAMTVDVLVLDLAISALRTATRRAMPADSNHDAQLQSVDDFTDRLEDILRVCGWDRA